MNRVLQYEPRDLTISVEAGLPFRELSAILAANRQMLPFDPPFSGSATIGGIVAANSSGPRRRLYGTARDSVIGMTFATLEGKLVKTGGMVVKNVAGLDMAKLMIGSFGTLAAIAVVNFKVHPIPEATRTFRWTFADIAGAIARRDAILESVLQPMSIDLLKQETGYSLLVQAGGIPAVLDRYSRELDDAEVLEGLDEESLWNGIREFTPMWLAVHKDAVVARISCPLTRVGEVIQSLPAPVIARAGNGVCYGYFASIEEAAPWIGKAAIEYAPQSAREQLELWPNPGSGFPTMQKLKALFDPNNLLNRRRLYGRI